MALCGLADFSLALGGTLWRAVQERPGLACELFSLSCTPLGPREALYSGSVEDECPECQCVPCPPPLSATLWPRRQLALGFVVEPRPILDIGLLCTAFVHLLLVICCCCNGCRSADHGR